MELTLLQKEKEILDKQKKSFNPCFIGTYSITLLLYGRHQDDDGF